MLRLLRALEVVFDTSPPCPFELGSAWESLVTNLDDLRAIVALEGCLEGGGDRDDAGLGGVGLCGIEDATEPAAALGLREAQRALSRASFACCLAVRGRFETGSSDISPQYITVTRRSNHIRMSFEPQSIPFEPP